MNKIRESLFQLKDEEYRQFHLRLMPGYDPDRVIGIRTPELRKLAKRLIANGETDDFLNCLPHRYYEENNLHGFIIENRYKDFDEAIEMLERLLPYIDNWATCDTISPKAFKTNIEKLYNKTLEWMSSDNTYTVRYGIVMQLRYFLDDDFRPEMLKRMAEIHTEEYYINMAIAWYYSMAIVKQYDATIPMFISQVLDKWIHNKAIQKAVESYRIDKEKKDYLRSLKIK